MVKHVERGIVGFEKMIRMDFCFSGSQVVVWFYDFPCVWLDLVLYRISGCEDGWYAELEFFVDWSVEIVDFVFRKLISQRVYIFTQFPT